MLLNHVLSLNQREKEQVSGHITAGALVLLVKGHEPETLFFSPSSSLCMSENSNLTISAATIAAKRSAKGPANTIPSIPKKTGRTISRGSRNRICLVSDTNIPFFGFPTEAKNCEVTG